jgi:glycine cleavage system H protein
MEYPKNLKYTPKHEWALVQKDTALVGITDYAQKALGDVVFVQLPEIGAETRRGEPFGAVESVKAASDIYAPLSGEVIEINRNLEEHPEHLNRSPYGDGWIVKIRVSDPGEAGELLDSAAYEELVKAEESAK